ncbi:nuclear transport factor 2 family protein [Pedobacter sandarakinus]|uniref:nuclear transport factor 2 family protein n=1 Tax=Pedobacter sandarakinus TaxID=353156 RepID=UPI002247F6BA|nr:nuclear transport factor 2 family protein [Pedobacter sandarakinus]MCX2574522.1 nuclear transport factor 2 family protein [Pedobacter sandarakinus]
MIRKIILVSIFLMLANFSFAQMVEVETTVSKLKQLMILPDSLALNKLISNQLSYGHSSGKVQNKQEFMHSLLSGESDFVDIELSDQKVTIENNTALVRHTLLAKTNDRNIPGNVRLYILLIFTKEKNSWKLLGRQAVKLP